MDCKLHYDENEERMYVEHVQDCTPIVDEVKRLKEVTDGRGDSSLGYFVGRIPEVIVQKYMDEMGVSYHEFVVDPIHIKRILNDPQYKRFRIFEGRV